MCCTEAELAVAALQQVMLSLWNQFVAIFSSDSCVISGIKRQQMCLAGLEIEAIKAKLQGQSRSMTRRYATLYMILQSAPGPTRYTKHPSVGVHCLSAQRQMAKEVIYLLGRSITN